MPTECFPLGRGWQNGGHFAGPRIELDWINETSSQAILQEEIAHTPPGKWVLAELPGVS